MKKIRRMLLKLETTLAIVTGFCWGMAGLLNLLDRFPDLPFSLTWYSLLWMPFVLWGTVFVVSRVGQVPAIILLINEKMRRLELYGWLTGLGLSILTFLVWLVLR